jgi:hypothetical protein
MTARRRPAAGEPGWREGVRGSTALLREPWPLARPADRLREVAAVGPGRASAGDHARRLRRHRASIRAIARAAGISPATVHRLLGVGPVPAGAAPGTRRRGATAHE